MDAPEQVLLDQNELAQGNRFVSIGAMVISDDQNLLAYTTDYIGYRQYSLHVKDLRTGQTLPDTTERVSSVALGSEVRDEIVHAEDGPEPVAGKDEDGSH
jgi:oligopeptidase B